jgi:hypothetical protein
LIVFYDALLTQKNRNNAWLQIKGKDFYGMQYDPLLFGCRFFSVVKFIIENSTAFLILTKNKYIFGIGVELVKCFETYQLKRNIL